MERFQLVEDPNPDKVTIYEPPIDTLKALFQPKEYAMKPEYHKLTGPFKAIYDEIDTNGDGQLEAGELQVAMKDADIRRNLAHFAVKHPTEWKWDPAKWDKFDDAFPEESQLAWQAEKGRIEKLCFWDDCAGIAANPAKNPNNPITAGAKGFPASELVTHIHPVAFVAAMKSSVTFSWENTKIVQLIGSKESKGSYKSYNITGWKITTKADGTTKRKNTVFHSYFSGGYGKIPADYQYDLEAMTIQKIKTEQKRRDGTYKKHLFAIGFYQCIPSTLDTFLKWLNSQGVVVDETKQLFNKDFQHVLTLFFWESKRPKIGKYFLGQASVSDAAYEVAKEWASASVPKGYKDKKGRVCDGTTGYYRGDGLNKAHYSATKTIKALEETKKLLDSSGGYASIKQSQLDNL